MSDTFTLDNTDAGVRADWQPEGKLLPEKDVKAIRAAADLESRFYEKASYYSVAEIKDRARRNERTLANITDPEETDKIAELVARDYALLSSPRIDRWKANLRAKASEVTRTVRPLIRELYLTAAQQCEEVRQKQIERERQDAASVNLEWTPSAVVRGLERRLAELRRGVDNSAAATVREFNLSA